VASQSLCPFLLAASRLVARYTAIMKASWLMAQEERAIANMVQLATRCVVLRFFVVSFEFMTLHGIDPSAND
jgi:hypothetical protein